jgi:hypothetical protein
MSVINQHIKYWLARLEIKAAATHRADRHAAHHRNTRRAIVEICEAIRERHSAELASIPDSEALRAADAAITRGDHNMTLREPQA